MKTRVRRLLGSLLVALLLSGLGINVVQAQMIVPDADTQTVVASPNHNPHQVDITGGTRSGSNLFHSFQQFGVSAGQIANFLSQPTIQNILGRITGGHVSRINGLIQVTGGNSNLFLMNPAGIIFGAQARLNVPAAFVATTANGIQIGNSWFNAIGNNDYANLTGNPESFAFLSHAGAILNAGVLTAQPGQRITLLGGVVVNTGTISAPGGTITIAAVPGQHLVRITQDGSVLSLLLPTETANAINSPTSAPLSLAALLTGGGLPEATGITVENGIVRLTNSGTVVSTEAGSATVSGTLSAAATTSPNPAKIQVFGDRISLQTATLDASGINGGTVRIGGDYQGSGTLPQARTTEMDANSIIRADAIANVPGNGGSAVIWSTDTTQVAGTITAQGSHYGGNGGLVETSSQGTLIVAPTTRVRTDAPQGQTGTWLLDPPELTVAADGAATIAGNPLTNTPTTATTISATAIVTGLNGNNVNLQASDRITVNAAIAASANPVAGDLTLTTPTTTLNQPISLAPGSILSGTATTVNINPGARIQNGVDVAASGGTVNVATGTFYLPGVTNQVSITKPLTMQGAGAGNTIVDGGGNSRGFYLDPGAGNTVNLDGLTIQNGYVASYIAGGDYVVENGAGILINSGIANLSNTTVDNNSAMWGGSGGGIYNSGTVNLSNSTVNSNRSRGGGGGGIYNSGTANLSNTTVSSNSATGSGGGIYNSGIVNLPNSTVTGNLATSGGGIYNSGTANLINSFISSNLAANSGGGIYNSGTANLINSIFSSNSARSGGGIYNDEYIYNFSFTPDIGNWFSRSELMRGNVTVTNSTLSRNSATDSGGGIYNAGTAWISSSTIANNSANLGGGVFNAAPKTNYATDFGGMYRYHYQGFMGRLTITDSTISSNLATGSGGGIHNAGVAWVSSSTIANNSANSGGGVFNAALIENVTSAREFIETVRFIEYVNPSAARRWTLFIIENVTSANTFSVRNSIIAGNAAASERELTNLGSSTSEGYNLFGFSGDSGVGGMAFSATDIVPSVAMNQILTPLGDHGGATQTHALVPGSPAIDMGDPSITTLDQRGFTRVGRADIGAAEFHAPLPPAPPPSPLPPAPPPSPLTSFTLPTFNPDELNQLSAALMGREIEAMTISIQPIPTASILCVDRSPTEAETPDLYQGIPDCP